MSRVDDSSKRRLLLDTCVFLWWQANDQKLTEVAVNAIQGADEVFVSAASIWEISIKVALGRLILPGSATSALAGSGFLELPISARHAERVSALPLRPDHKDPFDRMLVTQAEDEQLVLVTADRKLESYGGKCLLIGVVAP